MKNIQNMSHEMEDVLLFNGGELTECQQKIVDNYNELKSQLEYMKYSNEYCDIDCLFKRLEQTKLIISALEALEAGFNNCDSNNAIIMVRCNYDFSSNLESIFQSTSYYDELSFLQHPFLLDVQTCVNYDSRFNNILKSIPKNVDCSLYKEELDAIVCVIMDEVYSRWLQQVSEDQDESDEEAGSGDSSQQTKNFNTEKLSDEDRATFYQMLEYTKDNCAYRKLIEDFNNGGSVSIITSGKSTGGEYSPSTKEIDYMSLAIGNMELFSHELFHAYQHQKIYGEAYKKYANIRTNNGTTTTITYVDGNINMEFEQIVFQDITKRVKHGTTHIGVMFKDDSTEESNAAKDDYKIWIDELTNEGTTYPNLQNRTNFDAEYLQHLTSFQQYGHPTYIKSKKIDSLKPLALKKFYNGTISTNCNN